MPRRLALIIVIASLVAAACGTRLPDSAFVRTEGAQLVDPDTGAIIDPETGQLIDPETGEVIGDGGLGGGSDGAAAGGSRQQRAARAGGGGQSGGGGQGGSAGGKANYASDAGVTATEIKVGNVTAVGGPLGPETFTGPFHGARAYFLDLNSRGGVNGRKVSFVTCDDKENSERNKACTRSLVNDSKVFALVANATDAQAQGSAEFLSQNNVPDVGSAPIGSEYYRWPTLYSIYGAEGYKRDGSEYGEGGKVYLQTAPYRWFKDELGITKAAVIYYATPAIAKQAGEFVIKGLEAEGIEVVYTPNNGAGRNPADPNFDQDVLGMQQAEAQAVWQTIDIAGFQRLCRSIDRFNATSGSGGQLKAVVGAANTMANSVGADFSAPCRNHVYVNTESWPFSDTSNPEVKRFQEAMARFDPNWKLSQWAFEGWVAAKLFTEGVASMGADVTRKGLIQWLDSQRDWTGGGVMAGIDWRRDPIPRTGTPTECIAISQWQDSVKKWVPRAKPFTCYDVPWIFYNAG